MTMNKSSIRCQALTKHGKPCRAAATEGGLCFFHANPNKAAELGRIGGRKSGRIPVGTEPLPILDCAVAVRDTVARLITDIYAGKLHPRIATGLAALMHLQLRVLEKTDFEQRLTKIERQLKTMLENQRNSLSEE
jgi:hypothetical protein